MVLGTLALQTRADGGFRLPDQPPKDEAREEGRSLHFAGDRGRSVSSYVCNLVIGNVFEKKRRSLFFFILI